MTLFNRYTLLFKSFFLMFVASLLLACGGGDENNSATQKPAIEGDFFPLESGFRWNYEVTTQDNMGREIRFLTSQMTEGTLVVGGEDVFAVREISPENGGLLSIDYISKTKDVIRSISNDEYPSVDILHFPIKQGDRFVQANRNNIDVGNDYDRDGINDTLSIYVDAVVTGLEDIQTPAGFFKGALKITGQGTFTYRYSSNGQQYVIKQSIVNWYADGVGLVKEINQYFYPNQPLPQTTTTTLQSYLIGSTTNDTLSPNITQISPAENSRQGGMPIVNVQFSENVNGRAFNPATVRLFSASGQFVAGKVEYSNKTLTFTPQAIVNSGDYIFTIVPNTVIDLVGNKIETAVELHFKVDSNAPSIIATSPLPDADMVPLDSSITLDFSEALDPTSIDNYSIQLLTQVWNTPIESTVSIEGKRVTLTPKSPLKRDTRYVVVISTSVKDITGNAIPETYSFKFSSYSGLFKPYQAIFVGSSPEAVTIGDVNGDSRNDVVMTTGFNSDAANDNKLIVFLQQADGSLSPPAKYSLSSDYICRAHSVAIADVDGDGKPEVVVGKNSCGIEVLGRTAFGNWVSRDLLPSVDAHKIRTADLNNDGKQDVVGTGWGTGTVSVWYQGVDGKLNSPVVYPIAHAGWEDMKVGDINADGLSDIVILSGQGERSTALGYILQLSAGGFSKPKYLDVSTASFMLGLGAIAIGDINGDARGDLVVAMGGNKPDSRLGLFLQSSGGVLAPMTTQPTLDIPNAVEIGDVDNNGLNDILILHRGWQTLSLYKQLLDGSLAPEEYFSTPPGTGENTHGLAVGDINGDGYQDVVMSNIGGNLIVLYNSSLKVAAATKSVALNRQSISAVMLENTRNNTRLKAKSLNMLQP